MKENKLINFCEFDPYATKSYCAIHNIDENLNLGDITKVDETKLNPFNMIVGGSPCQDFSVAGKQKGSVWTCKECKHEYNPLTVHWSERDKCPECKSENLDKSRSSLLVEWLRVIRANRPNFGIYENVKNIVGKQFKETTFKIFETELHEYGYNTYWKILNAKNYGVPQNRERVYLILIKKELDNGKFKFPEPFDNGLRLKDILEDVVDEKYYITNDKAKKLLQSNFMQERLRIQQTDVCGCLLARDYKDPKCVPIDKSYNNPKPIDIANCLTAREDRGISNRSQEGTAILETNNQKRLGGLYDDETKHQAGSVWDTEYIAPTVDTMQGGNRQPCIVDNNIIQIKQSTKQGYIECELGEAGVCKNETPYRIRKLTPKECFRLMSFSDEDFDKAQAAGISNSQLYKQAGNSIVVRVLFEILVELHNAMPYLFDNLKLGSYFSGIGAFEKALDRLYEYINVTEEDKENFSQSQVI